MLGRLLDISLIDDVFHETIDLKKTNKHRKHNFVSIQVLIDKLTEKHEEGESKLERPRAVPYEREEQVEWRAEYDGNPGKRVVQVVAIRFDVDVLDAANVAEIARTMIHVEYLVL